MAYQFNGNGGNGNYGNRQQGTGKSSSNENRIGALWKRISKNGRFYFSGQVEVNGERIMLTVFENGYKQAENQPDFIIYKSTPMPQQRNTGYNQNQSGYNAGGYNSYGQRPNTYNQEAQGQRQPQQPAQPEQSQNKMQGSEDFQGNMMGGIPEGIF